MLPMIIVFLVMLFVVYYIALEIILFKGKQHNRFFATLLNTFVPVFGSVPVYIMACKYERRMFREKCELNNMAIRLIMSFFQILSILALYLPLFQVDNELMSGISFIFGKSSGGQSADSVMFLVYLAALPALSVLLNLIFRKSNVSNFFAYFVSLINSFSVVFLNAVLSVDILECSVYVWLYCILNVIIMGISMLSLVSVRDAFLYKLEYAEKVEYIKEQQKKKEQQEESEPANDSYKCARCGNFVKKGTICSCIERKSEENATKDESAKTEEEKIDKYCADCGKPLTPGEKCTCKNMTINIESDDVSKPKRKCIYCGQTLVGESTCVCEKIMKNSAPVADKTNVAAASEPDDSKAESSIFVSDELAELDKLIDSRFEKLKEKIGVTDGNN